MKHILIVDDNLTNLEQISIQIEDVYDISLAKSGAQALVICQKAEPDLILLDIEMPDMDGFETLAKLRENISLRQVPVVFLTASHDPKTEVKAIKSGASDFVSKPVEREILLHKIETHLKLVAATNNMDNLVRELENSILLAFSDLIEHRTLNHRGASKRTAGYVKILAEELLAMDAFPGFLNPKVVDLLTRAAPLHDIGKIGVSDMILLKPALLNDEEFLVMKNHAALGAQIIKRVFENVPNSQALHDFAVTMALCHHERWDGKGYPKGLKGEEIPPCARIMAVADVFDAMTDNRSYKTPMGAAEAFRVILSGRGTIFDPKVIDAFEATKDKIVELAETKSAS
ncbi:MAG: response regulator [Deltaproteobacteria bacterium]|jgi:putative two-component system response regulator|nr:response regulator [Deltaproteobacteria bacterium]